MSLDILENIVKTENFVTGECVIEQITVGVVDRTETWPRGTDGQAVIRFKDGRAIALTDDGQSCCEHRYMTCDDDLAHFVGSILTGIEVRYVDEDHEAGVHETAFLILTTSLGTITIANHNEHNEHSGYYGGFDLTATILPAPNPAV